MKKQGKNETTQYVYQRHEDSFLVMPVKTGLNWDWWCPGVIGSADFSFTNIPNTISSGYLISVENYSKKNKREIS